MKKKRDKAKNYRTCEIQVTPFDLIYNELDHMLFLSKNLFNVCLYIERQLFFEKRNCQDPVLKNKLKGIIHNFKLSKQLQDVNDPDYRALPAAVAQQVCKQVYEAFKSFFNKIKKGLSAEIPRYLHKIKGRNKISFTKNNISKQYLNGILKLTGLNCIFKIPDYIDPKTIQQVDIIKTANRTIKVLIIYTVPEVQLKEDNGRVLGIDLGVNNLMSVVSNTNDFKPIIYDGKHLKSVNQFCNKQISDLKSKSKNTITEKICSILRNRMNQIKDCLHKYSTDLINRAVSNDFNTIVIGKNDLWKQEVKLNKANNQNFVSIPHNTLIEMIKYKAEFKGIKVIETNESYTSKCSFFDNEVPCKHEKYKGQRVKRGMFKSSLGCINADLNGALNIIKKVFKEFNYETANLDIKFFKSIIKVRPKTAV